MSNSLEDKLKEKRLKELEGQLESARMLSPDEIAFQIQELGFECLRCGECCTGTDNSVVLFPLEIRQILEQTGESWLESVEPPITGEWDDQGNFHTLEWRIKKLSGSCRYYHARECLCRIYGERPILCSTYPFYIEEGLLRCSECRGLGRKIDNTRAMEMANQLIDRYITEIEEAISLVRMFKDFPRGGPSKKGSCVVHDSEGEHHLTWTKGLLRRCLHADQCNKHP